MNATSKRDVFFSFFMFTADLRPQDPDYTGVLINHLKALTDMGYDGFDVHIAPQPATVDHKLEVDSYVGLKKAFDKAGLKEVKFTTNVGTTRTFDPTSPYEEQRSQALSYLKSRVDITRVLGGDSIMSGPFLYPYGVFPLTDADEPMWSDALQDWMKPRFHDARSIFEDLVAYAAAQEVKLALEPVKSWESPPPNMVSEALDFLEGLEHPHGGVTMDTAQIVMERLGERHHGMLGHVVRAGAGRRDEAGDRSGVDDVALVLRDQPRREGAHAVDHAPQIDAEDPLPVAGAVFPHRAEGRDARVVAHEVDRA